MHNPVQRKIRLGFFIAFSVIIAASFFSYLVTKNLLDNAGRLNHTIEVSKRLETIIKQLKDAEAAIRGFSLTNDSSFLHPDMQERSNSLQKEYEALRSIVIDSHRQQQHMDTLKTLLAVKYQQLQAGISSGSPRTERLSVTEGEKTMDRIEHVVEDMMQIEDTQLHEKTELFHFFSSLWIPVIFISSIVAILIGLYSYITLTKEFKLQLHIESKLKSYQRDLQQNIQLLNKSNQELEQFAYVASHDLQEPLRKISTFSDRLQVKYKDQLPPDASQLIDRMIVAVGRMRILINDLLLFSRAGRVAPESITEVDMSALLQNVLSDLEVALQEKNAVVHSAQLPIIEGNITNFQQLFQNILTNAIKFSQEDRQLEINISSQLLKGKEINIVKENRWDETFCRICIEDNGIGFDPDYAERIFLIFQRLHGISEYSGTGIGLAICKKIVDSHQGYIMAYGYPGKGAAFVIILPVKQKK
ncbi:His Kinase A (phospho-acceptor) domain-containing protein [Chitinophaga rupis]|uniref:histidine kinase n=1 Tax=Chitinophaga rupis TaxID=573321 RepID=A0A1H7L7M8_9BACT|nr:sensor histidine kinase [Chitinophaga rupis]SEK94277.1 His Kinase A (phospho-acceptor) domain-containing protein [Chitinophaga rupis]